MKKAVVLSSGGLDSTTCLALAVNNFGPENVIALSLLYGQKHKKELEAAERVAAYYGTRRIILDVGEIFKGSDCALLEWGGNEIPEESYGDQVKKTDGRPVPTYVPFRNGLFLSAAASIALSNGCCLIYYGAHRDDAAGDAYPDCSEDFNRAIGDAIHIGSGRQLTVVAPFIQTNKAGVVRKGLELGVPYELTWSCYEGGDEPCGRCGTCIDRENAFKANGVEDPVWKK